MSTATQPHNQTEKRRRGEQVNICGFVACDAKVNGVKFQTRSLELVDVVASKRETRWPISQQTFEVEKILPDHETAQKKKRTMRMLMQTLKQKRLDSSLREQNLSEILMSDWRSSGIAEDER